MTKLVLVPGRPGPSLIARFLAESTLGYPLVDGIDARLQAWATHEGRWAVAFTHHYAAGIACIVTLDDGPYAGADCLFWIEVLPETRGNGLGRALLSWATQQTPRLIINPTPGAAPFYAALLPHAQRHGDLFIVAPADRGMRNVA